MGNVSSEFEVWSSEQDKADGVIKCGVESSEGRAQSSEWVRLEVTLRLKSNLIEPGSTLTVIFMLSAISMTTTVVVFMSFSMVLVLRNKNTTPECDQ